MMWPVATDKDGAVMQPYFSYYFGPIWSDKVETLPMSTRHRVHADGLSTIIEHLVERYPTLCFELAPNFLDLRPFKWWNFGADKSQQFLIEPMYSAQIRGLELQTSQKVFDQFRSVRQRAIRRVDAERQLEFTTDVSWSAVTTIYEAILEKSDIWPEDASRGLAGLEKLVKSGWGLTVGSKMKGDGSIQAATVVLRAKRVANLALGGAAPTSRNNGILAWHTFQTMKELSLQGDHIVDFNGANSPKRGDDKHSYGAVESLYFRLTFGKLQSGQPPSPELTDRQIGLQKSSEV